MSIKYLGALILTSFLITFVGVKVSIADLSCRTDAFGTTRCSDGAIYRKDAFGTIRDNQGSSWRSDAFGTLRGSDGTTYRQDAFGNKHLEEALAK